MARRLRESVRRGLDRTEGLFDGLLGRETNPLNQLGALTIFFFWVVLVSGIYLFVFFRTSVTGAYESVEQLTHGQWYLGGVMRSLHRYASDAAVLTIALHIVRELIRGRYRGARWFSWFTGVPQLWIVFPLGITGYWLVWDQLAAHVAIVSAELMDWLPIFTDPMARNFLTDATISDRFFTLLAFLHLLALPIFLVFGIWFHVLRISRPRINPDRRLMIGSLVALTALSFVLPATSQGPAELGYLPESYGYDWFYLFLYPLHQEGSPAVVWTLLFGSSLLLSLLPWLPPRRRAPAAEVDPSNCNGCERCYDDCPYAAITLVPHDNGKRGVRMPEVNPELCVACGICAGACPSATPFRRASELVNGIDMPELTVQQLRETLATRARNLTSSPRLAVFGCRHAVPVSGLADAGTVVQSLPCIGNLPPSFIDYALRRLDMDGVFVTGCPPEACHHRLGSLWTEQRLRGEREPRLKSRVPAGRTRVFWARPHQAGALEAELARFRATLADTDDGGRHD